MLWTFASPLSLTFLEKIVVHYIPKSKSVWQIKKAEFPVDLALSIDDREGVIPLNSVNCVKKYFSPSISVKCVESVEPIDEVICDSTLKPLSLISLVYFEEGNILSNYLEAGVEHMDNFILGESSLKDLGFSSPIKVSKGTGSGYFLRSSSKVLLDSVSSIGFRRLLTPTKLVESMKGFDHSDVVGALREVDSCCRVSL